MFDFYIETSPFEPPDESGAWMKIKKDEPRCPDCNRSENEQ